MSTNKTNQCDENDSFPHYVTMELIASNHSHCATCGVLSLPLKLRFCCHFTFMHEIKHAQVNSGLRFETLFNLVVGLQKH